MSYKELPPLKKIFPIFNYYYFKINQYFIVKDARHKWCPRPYIEMYCAKQRISHILGKGNRPKADCLSREDVVIFGVAEP